MNKIFQRPHCKMVLSDRDGYISFTGSYNGGSGACGDRVVKEYPEFEFFNKMHLRNTNGGVPMHAFSNAVYHLKEGNVESAKRSLGVDDVLFGEWLKVIGMVDKGDDVIEVEKMEYEVVKKIRKAWKNDLEKLYELAESTEDSTLMTVEDDEFNEDDYDDRALALAAHLDIHPNEVEQSTYDQNTFEACGEEYLVVDDDEADELWDQDLDNYLDDCLLPELEGTLAQYFDREAWKSDARVDGRAHSLGRYDGCEHYEGDFYIYRTN